MLSIKLKQMRKKVLEELEHIPKGSIPQGEPRGMYWIKRIHSSGKKAKINRTPRDVLDECISYLKRGYPDSEFGYDQAFFNHQQLC